MAPPKPVLTPVGGGGIVEEDLSHVHIIEVANVIKRVLADVIDALGWPFPQMVPAPSSAPPPG